MADALSVIPAAVLRNLSDKLYEKRKNAALEVEGIVKQLSAGGDHDKITSVINLLTGEFTCSPQANHRKGGLIGLAAATVGLSNDAAQHLEQIVPPVLNSFSDQDSRVRYYACEALYNIAKVVRGDFIVFFNQIFDALCKLSADSDPNVQSAAHLLDRLVKDIVTESDQFSIEEFIPLLRERMNVLNPYVRQFLVGWITVLDSVPDIDMLGFLPDFLDGLFNMLSDSSHEIRQQADSALSEFLQEIKNSPSVDYGRMAEILVQRASSKDEFTRLTAITWINEFVKLGGDQLVPYYADILGAILPCISDKEEKIRVVARETNEELRAIQADPAEGFDVGAILFIARSQLSSEWEATRIEALHWISTLLNRHRAEVLSFLNDIFDTLLKALSDQSDEVVLLVLEVHACIAKDPQHFRHLVVFLVHNFQIDNTLLEKRGALIIRRLCVLLDAERVYRELSTILEGESDLDFASIMVQALNLILLTSSELSELRYLLKQSLVNPAGKDLFVSLYSSWCHSPMAIISLCLLAQAYQHASTIVQSLVEEDINVKFLVQLDKLIHLLETPIFAYLRLQLLEPGRYIWLLKALYGLLMLLPQQSKAFKILRTRLKTVPSYSFNGEQFQQTSGDSYSQIHRMLNGSQVYEDGDVGNDFQSMHSGINFASRLQQFEQMQQLHRVRSKSQTQSRYSSTSSTRQDMQRPEEHGVRALKVTRLQLSQANRSRCNSHGGGALGSQMNLFDRFARVVKSYANAIISSFEDPEKILEQTVLEMNDDLIKMRQATAQVLASQKQLENKYKSAQQASEDWYKRAQLALGKGDEDLAREALKRRKAYADNANALKAQLDQQKSIVDNLVSNTRLLESKIQEARSKKDTLKARAQSAKTATKVTEMLGNVNTSSALSAFEKMEEKVLAMESQADALNQLTSDELEGKFALLETSSVDDDLANLKKELSGSTKKGELPPGRSPATSASSAFPFQDTEIERELNELRRKAKDF